MDLKRFVHTRLPGSDLHLVHGVPDGLNKTDFNWSCFELEFTPQGAIVTEGWPPYRRLTMTAQEWRTLAPFLGRHLSHHTDANALNSPPFATTEEPQLFLPYVVDSKYGPSMDLTNNNAGDSAVISTERPAAAARPEGKSGASVDGGKALPPFDEITQRASQSEKNKTGCAIC